MSDKPETVEVSYVMKAPATLLGIQKVPKAMWDRLRPNEQWSDEIEEYLKENHDWLLQPPEVDDFDLTIDDVSKIAAPDQKGQDT